MVSKNFFIIISYLKSETGDGATLSGKVRLVMFDTNDLFPASSITTTAKKYVVLNSMVTVGDHVSAVPETLGMGGLGISVAVAKLLSRATESVDIRNSYDVAVPIIPSSPTAVHCSGGVITTPTGLELGCPHP
jgi:hypothetical protein